MSLSLSYWYPGSGVVLDCIDPDRCTLTYFSNIIKILQNVYQHSYHYISLLKALVLCVIDAHDDTMVILKFASSITFLTFVWYCLCVFFHFWFVKSCVIILMLSVFKLFIVRR